MSTVYVKAYYRISEQCKDVSHSVQPFVNEEDADCAAWLCASMPGCVSAQIVKRELVTSTEVREIVTRVYARGESGFVEDFTAVAEALQQLREAGAQFEVC